MAVIPKDLVLRKQNSPRYHAVQDTATHADESNATSTIERTSRLKPAAVRSTGELPRLDSFDRVVYD